SDTPIRGWNSNSWTGRFLGGFTGNVISGRDGTVWGGGVRGLNSRRSKSVVDERGVVGGGACSGAGGGGVGEGGGGGGGGGRPGRPDLTLGISANSRMRSAAPMPPNRSLDEPV